MKKLGLLTIVMVHILFEGFDCYAFEKLPPGISRFNPAGISKDWEYQGTSFKVLLAPDKSLKTTPVIRLYSNKSGFLLTASDDEAAKSEAKGFVRQGIAFYVPLKTSQPVYRFTAPAGTGYYYSANRNDPAAAGLRYEGIAFHACDDKSCTPSDTTRSAQPVYRYRSTSSGHYLLTAGNETPYQVGAFYFGSFGPSATTIINGTSRVYNRKNDWWGGVADFYGKEPGITQNTRNWPGTWPHLKPAIGYYNQQSTDTLKKHIRQASDAGLGFFSFYWYWSNKNNGEMFPEALQSFYKANQNMNFKFNLTLYAHPWNDDMAITPANSQKVINSLVEIFADKNYLRLADGRPVFAMGDHRNIRAHDGSVCKDTMCYTTAVDRFFEDLKTASVKKLGVAPYIQIQVGAPGWDKTRLADNITCLVPPTKMQGEMKYPAFDTSVFKPLSNAGKTVSACMLQNFDERPRQDVLVANRSDIRYFVNKTEEGLRHNLESTKKFADEEFARTKDPAARIIYLYAWNEWHEGGILEPNVATGARDLNIVTDVFQLPRLPSKCLEAADCL